MAKSRKRTKIRAFIAREDRSIGRVSVSGSFAGLSGQVNKKSSLAPEDDALQFADVGECKRMLSLCQAIELRRKAAAVNSPEISALLEARSNLAFLRAAQGACLRHSLSERPGEASGTSLSGIRVGADIQVLLKDTRGRLSRG